VLIAPAYRRLFRKTFVARIYSFKLTFLLVKLRLTLQTLPVAQKHQTDLAKA